MEGTNGIYMEYKCTHSRIIMSIRCSIHRVVTAKLDNVVCCRLIDNTTLHQQMSLIHELQRGRGENTALEKGIII